MTVMLLSHAIFAVQHVTWRISARRTNPRQAAILEIVVAKTICEEAHGGFSSSPKHNLRKIREP
jgi:hypothetical protein